jgi:hypothetical protein
MSFAPPETPVPVPVPVPVPEPQPIEERIARLAAAQNPILAAVFLTMMTS